MALRGWRLFGVAGTLIAYLTGILLLSFTSLNNPSQRRSKSARFGDFDNFKHRELIIGRRQPLIWCRELKFLDSDVNRTIHKQSPKLLQTFPGHFIKSHIKNNYRLDIKKNSESSDQIINNNRNNQNLLDSKLEIKSKEFEKILLDTKLKNDSKILTTKVTVTTTIPQEFISKKLIALASFPGSGNTWLRYLLQQATGILTGSVYKDFGLLKSGFPGELISNSSVLVIKTHEWGAIAWANFSKAILLIRDPDKAIMAEFNRQSGGHVGFASPDRYKRTKGRYWQQFVTNKLWSWEQMNIQWAKNFPGDVLIIYYDDMVENVEKTLRDILNFIKYPIDEELLACALMRKEGIYRRKRRIMTFDPYTAEMHNILDSKKYEVYVALGRIKEPIK